MQIENYLKTYQHITYQILKNAFISNKLSHAYLLSGHPGTPLLEVAKFLGKSILCDSPNPFACESCITCLRVEDDNYPDFVVFDSSQSTVKKEMIFELESRSQMEALESKGIRIYIINLIENLSVQATNSLLKFLEEPGDNIYAFLTTHNENLVLPTILSRCQTLNLKLIEQAQIIKDAQEMGIEQKDAELLSYFYNNAALIQDLLKDENKKDTYIKAKTSLDAFLNKLINNDFDETIYYVDRELINNLKDRSSVTFFIDLLIYVFEQLILFTRNRETILKSYDTILAELSKLIDNPDTILLDLLKCHNLVKDANLSLLFDHVVINIFKGKN